MPSAGLAPSIRDRATQEASPDALEVGAGRLRDLDRLQTRFETPLLVELELVQPREPHVRNRKLGRRACRLEHASRLFEFGVCLCGPALLPLATCEYEAVTRRLEFLARGVETRYALSQHSLGCGRLTVGPEHASHPAQQPGALERIADVRERSFEHLQRLGKCERRLGFVRRLETGRHGVVEAGRFE